MDPDRELLEDIGRGDEDSLRILIDRHREKLFRYVYRYVRNEADAAELVSETFIRVYGNAERFRPEAKVATWIFAIAANLCRDHHRKQSRRRWLSLFGPASRRDGENVATLIESISDPGRAADEQVMIDERRRLALRAIDGLPAKLKAPFILHVLEEHSQKECATILGVTEKTVETRIYRARKRLLNRLADAED